ncbi:MAG: putative fluoride ion transporter CrcB [Cyclobacteriaceae bacterium]|nr:MAG: putative fluoride ion transporter CrcB [Cyclobacteriaceae bacterium]
MDLLKPFILVGIGGMIGSISRYALQLLISGRTFSLFPWGTFAVNIAGCLLIGVLVGLESRHELVSDPLKWLFITGFCGGFTTFSTYSIEGLGLLQQQQYLLFFGYAGGSVIAGLLVTFMGYSMVRVIL